MKKIFLPATVILVGMGWLLTSLGILPGVRWAIPATLAFLGTLILVIDTISRFSFTVGLTLGLSALFSVLQQIGALPQGTVLPLSLLVLGLLWLLSYLLIRKSTPTLPRRNPPPFPPVPTDPKHPQ